MAEPQSPSNGKLLPAVKPWEKGVERALAEQKRRKAAGMPIGRPRGSPNELTATTRKALLKVFENLGGIDGMERWARKNKSAFYQLLVKATPKEREANARGTGITVIVGGRPDEGPHLIEVTPE